LIIDAAGNLYGVTGYGGTGDCVLVGIKAGCGTVYELSLTRQQGGAWTETILYSFQGGNDGYFPSGNLVFDKNGNLYGATQFGGGKGTTCNSIYGGQCGTVFKLSPPKQKGGAWTEQVLHSFEGLMGGQQTGDGANPNGGLVLDSKGLTYGTTQIGGYNCPHNSNQGCGTVFALKPPRTKGGIWAEKQVHVFKNGDDGANPNGGLIFDTKGSLYGTAAGGPNQGVGVVFRLTNLRASMSKETVLYAFNNNGESGADPLAGLTLGAGGDLFGTTSVGSGQSRRGNVFRLKAPARSPGAWSLNVLYGFADGVPDGENPGSGLVFDKAGNCYSTTQYGGSATGCSFQGCGTVFRLKP
jgi:hypothetical protein